MPISPQIERDWGIRFTSITLMADRGMVELRYEVVDSQKADRIHSGKGAEYLPAIQAESNGRWTTSQDLLFNIHRGMQNAPEGRQFSIIYGNVNGSLREGHLATIRMYDGLVLKHAPIVT